MLVVMQKLKTLKGIFNLFPTRPLSYKYP